MRQCCLSLDAQTARNSSLLPLRLPSRPQLCRCGGVSAWDPRACIELLFYSQYGRRLPCLERRPSSPPQICPRCWCVIAALQLRTMRDPTCGLQEFENGTRVEGPAQWEARREELKRLTQAYMLGSFPTEVGTCARLRTRKPPHAREEQVPALVSAKVVQRAAMYGSAVSEQVCVCVCVCACSAELSQGGDSDASRTGGACVCHLQSGDHHRGNHCSDSLPDSPAACAADPSQPPPVGRGGGRSRLCELRVPWRRRAGPIKSVRGVRPVRAAELTHRGRARAAGVFADAYPSATFQVIARRAWLASRVVDYLLTRPDVDASKIMITGHSRNGKQSIVAGERAHARDGVRRAPPLTATSQLHSTCESPLWCRPARARPSPAPTASTVATWVVRAALLPRLVRCSPLGRPFVVAPRRRGPHRCTPAGMGPRPVVAAFSQGTRSRQCAPSPLTRARLRRAMPGASTSCRWTVIL